MEREIPPITMPWTATDVPHVTIEVNQLCNLNCQGCYKQKYSAQKPLATVIDEINFAASNRNLETVTLLGGEPTLHPQICQIVSYVHKKGLRPHILSNATTLNPSLVQQLHNAGAARITMHIDSHQGVRPDVNTPSPNERDLNDLRRKYITLCHENGVETGLAVTLYRDNLADFLHVIALSEQTGASRILATAYCQEANSDVRSDDGLSLTNRDVRTELSKHSLHPCWSIGSESDETELRWMIYTAAISRHPNTGDVHRLPFKPQHRLAMWAIPRLTRVSKGRHRFESTPAVHERVVGLLIYALLALFSPEPWGAFQILRFLLRAARNRDLYFHSVIVQELPRPRHDGTYDPCKNCPDATVRNNKLIPVCYVDRVEPLPDFPIAP